MADLAGFAPDTTEVPPVVETEAGKGLKGKILEIAEKMKLNTKSILMAGGLVGVPGLHGIKEGQAGLGIFTWANATTITEFTAVSGALLGAGFSKDKMKGFLIGGVIGGFAGAGLSAIFGIK